MTDFNSLPETLEHYTFARNGRGYGSTGMSLEELHLTQSELMLFMGQLAYVLNEHYAMNLDDTISRLCSTARPLIEAEAVTKPAILALLSTLEEQENILTFDLASVHAALRKIVNWMASWNHRSLTAGRFLGLFRAAISGVADAAIRFLTFFLHLVDLTGVTALMTEIATILFFLEQPFSSSGSRQKGKSLWPPLIRYHKSRFSPTELLAMDMATVKYTPRDLREAVKFHCDLLNSVKPDGAEPFDPEDTFLHRPVRFPNKHVGTKEEWERVNRPEMKLVSPPWFEERVNRLVKMGAKRGLDALLLDSDEKRYQSASRYLTAEQGNEPHLKELARRAAETLFQKYPASWPETKLSTPEQVIAYEEKKYSAGAMLMKKYGSRAAAYEAGWDKALANGVRRCLAMGEYPTQLHHLFGKSQVVSFADADKKLRTVVAEDLLCQDIDKCARFDIMKQPWAYENDNGLGAPSNEPYFRRVFTDIMQYKQTMEGDISDADARLPGFVWEGLNYIWSRAGRGGLVGDAITAITKAHNEALRNSWIVDLAAAKWYHKTTGGGTGQSSTSHDNTTGVKILIMVGWAVITGQDIEDFFEHNHFVNTGDDNLWGTNTPESVLNKSKFCRWMMENLGINFKIKAGHVTDLSYLSRKLVPVTSDDHELYTSRGLEIPEYKVVTMVENSMMRRTAFKVREGGYGPLKFTEYQLQRDIGHIMMTAHIPELYDVIAREYAEDVQHLAHLIDVKVTVLRNKKGLIHDVQVRATSGSPAARHIISKYKLPPYRVIMDRWLIANEPKGKSAKPAYRRFLRNMPAELTPVYKMLNWFRSQSDASAYTAMHRLGPEPDFAPLTARWYDGEYTIERFVWLRNYDNALHGPGFEGLMRQSPFSAATDSVGFSLLFAQEEIREVLLPANWLELEAKLQTRIFLIIFLYWSLHSIVGIARTWPVVWWIAELFLVWVIDRPRFFALLGLLFWTIYAYSNVTISNLIPKDAYLDFKRAAVMMADLIPLEAYPPIYTRPLMEKLGYLFELIAQTVTSADVLITSPRRGLIDTSAWALVIEKKLLPVLQHPDNTRSHVLLISGMSTGKSSLFISALQTSLISWSPGARLILTSPGIALAKSVNLDSFFDQSQWQYVDRATELNPNALIYSCTPGHALARLSMGDFKSTDIYIFDEVNVNQEEAVLLYFSLPPSTYKIGMTGTPEGLIAFPGAEVINTEMPNRFPLTVYTSQYPGVVETVMEAQIMKPDLFDSLLILVPTVREAQTITKTLSAIPGVEVDVWYGKRRQPQTRVIVATQIAERGVDIKPAKKYLINSGRCVRVHRGRFYGSWVEDKATMDQRHRRVGRTQEGWAWRCLQPLADTPALPLPNWTSIDHLPNRQEILERYQCTAPLLMFQNEHRFPGYSYYQLLPVARQAKEYADNDYNWLGAIILQTYAPDQTTFFLWLGYLENPIGAPEEFIHTHREISQRLRAPSFYFTPRYRKWLRSHIHLPFVAVTFEDTFYACYGVRGIDFKYQPRLDFPLIN